MAASRGLSAIGEPLVYVGMPWCAHVSKLHGHTVAVHNDASCSANPPTVVRETLGDDFRVRYNPPMDGNCQFHAVVDQLHMWNLDSNASHNELRSKVVELTHSLTHCCA